MGETAAGPSPVGAAHPSARLLIVDDEASNATLLEKVLARAGYCHLRSILDARSALPEVATFGPDIVLLDLHMPHIDGYEVLARIRAQTPADEFLPVIVLTADATDDAKRRALAAGANDFLTKPFDIAEVILRVSNLLATRSLHDEVRRHNAELEQRVRDRTRELDDARAEILWRLALAAEYRDDATHAHTRRVGTYAMALGRAVGYPPERLPVLGEAAPLHDIGKIGISDAVLLKPGALTPDEFEHVKSHAEIGARILAGSVVDVLRVGEEVALSHHERWDGSGYPRGLRGGEIPLSGRIVAVVDVFDALTHRRPYKPAWPVDRAVEEIRYQRGRFFDPDVADAFLPLVEAGVIAAPAPSAGS